MDLYSQTKHHTSISLTPLIDMVFLLVVFFMLTATFHLNEGIEIGFSSDAPTQEIGDMDAIIIAVDGQNNILLNDSTYDIEGDLFSMLEPLQFTQQMRQLLKETSTRQIQIYITGNATVQHVVRAIDLIQQAGGSNITFVDQNL